MFAIAPSEQNVDVTADGRFAPSPTGPLHLGSLRTALAAWLFARSQSARFLVRIEDLDAQRARSEYELQQLADLRALGIEWDLPVVRQSKRTSLYDHALEELQHQGRLYPCFCTRAEIREAASAPHGESPEGAYPRTCTRLTKEEQSRRIAEGRRYALRVRADAERIEFDDRLLGRVGTIVDDFVVRRADGVPAYQLAVVVDDAEQGIGEVVRGADQSTRPLDRSCSRGCSACRCRVTPMCRSCSRPTVRVWRSAIRPRRSPSATSHLPRR